MFSLGGRNRIDVMGGLERIRMGGLGGGGQVGLRERIQGDTA